MSSLLPPVSADPFHSLVSITDAAAPSLRTLGLPRSRKSITEAAAAPRGKKGAGADGGAGGGVTGAAKPPELKEALLEVTPVFFALVKEASRKQPGSAVRLYRRVASALVVLGWWNAGRAFNAGPRRQYPLLNTFLEKTVAIVTECEGILGCEGDQGCVVDTVEQQQMSLKREVARTAKRPSLSRSRGAGRRPALKK